jgi:hypothetical protein
MVNLSDVNFDEYQRDLSEKFILKLSGNFDMGLFDPPILGERPDNSLWCIDGKGRHFACERLGLDPYPARIVKSSGKHFESEQFIKLNGEGRRSVKGIAAFNAGYHAGRKPNMEIKAILDSHSLSLGWGDKVVGAISSLFKAHENKLLDDILSIIIECNWSGKNRAFSKSFMDGIILAMGRKGDMDRSIVISSWKRRDPEQYIDAGRRRCRSITEGVSDELLLEYEKGSEKVRVLNVQNNNNAA